MVFPYDIWYFHITLLISLYLNLSYIITGAEFFRLQTENNSKSKLRGLVTQIPISVKSPTMNQQVKKRLKTSKK